MMREMPVRIVSDGVLTRSVRDTAAFYREAEKVWRNPLLAPVGDVTRPSRARLRVELDNLRAAIATLKIQPTVESFQSSGADCVTPISFVSGRPSTNSIARFRA